MDLIVQHKYCETHGRYDYPSTIVNRICHQGYTFDTKIMIAIGILYWFFNYQRREIQIIFSARGIDISTGEISRLSEEFLLRFYVIHKKYSSQLNDFFERIGGMVMHLDGTYESGDDVVFVVKESRTGITLDARVMASESRKYIKPFLEDVRLSFGVPVAIVRDMSEEISIAASEVFPNSPHQICHYHFVRNLGDIIFKSRYETLRRNIINTHILAKFISLKSEIYESLSKNKLFRAEETWVILAIEYLLHPREIPSGYPFILPYFEIIIRAVEIRELSKRIVKWNASHNFVVRAVSKLGYGVDNLLENENVMREYYRMEHILRWFNKIRDVLRISRNISSKEQTDIPISAGEMQEDLKEVLGLIEKEGEELGGELKSVTKKIVANCDRHWDELIVHVNDHFDNEIKIVRHNGVEELDHRWCRMNIRRRTGRNNTNKQMKKYGALITVLSNLKNIIYISRVLANIDDFVREVQNVSKNEIENAQKLVNGDKRIILVNSDKKRLEILYDLVTILESNENRNKVPLESWFSQLSNPTLY